MAAKSIEEPQEGGSTWELWKTVRELVKAVNALNNMQITPTGIGKVQVSDANVSIDLNVGPKC